MFGLDQDSCIKTQQAFHVKVVDLQEGGGKESDSPLWRDISRMLHVQAWRIPGILVADEEVNRQWPTNMDLLQYESLYDDLWFCATYQRFLKSFLIIPVFSFVQHHFWITIRQLYCTMVRRTLSTWTNIL